MRRNFEIRPRRAATGPVDLQQVPRDAVLDQADEIARFAMSLLAEDERHRAARGDEIRFGPWLSGPSATRMQDRVARLVVAAAEIRLHPDPTSSVFTTTKSFAAHAGLQRTRLLDDLAPRAQLLATLMAAAFAVDGLLGPVAAYLLYADADKAGRDAHAFGIHNVPGESAFSRIMGMAGLGPDTCVPVTAHALITDMPHVTADRERAIQEMGQWGLAVPDGLSDHVAHALQIVGAAREVVTDAVGRSRTCREAGIRAEHMLGVGFSRWVVLGSVQVGPRRSGTTAGGRRVFPGLDAAIMRAARLERFHPLAHAAELTVAGQTTDAASAEIVYASGGRAMQGIRLLDALLTADTAALPEMSELSGAQLRAIEQHARGRHIPCSIGARYLVMPPLLRLTSDGKPLAVSALVRIGPLTTMMWTTTLDLTKPEALAGAIARAELHIRSIEDPTLNRTVKDYCVDHDVHRLQAGSYKTHTALRIVTMLANLAAVGVARAHQTGRGPTTR